MAVRIVESQLVSTAAHNELATSGQETYAVNTYPSEHWHVYPSIAPAHGGIVVLMIVDDPTAALIDGDAQCHVRA